MEPIDPPLPPVEDISELRAPAPLVEKPVFTGSGKEYFGIWIVNILLTLVTVGFYLPWARVRTRRYFHENTQLFGLPFDYLAEGKRILVGYLIIAALYGLYTLGTLFNPYIAIGVVVLGLIVFPWLIYKAFRFRAAYTAYRNVPFAFKGRVGGAYRVYMGASLLLLPTFGLIWPYVKFLQKEYLHTNIQFGHLRSRFEGQNGYFFKVYFLTGLCLTIVNLVIGAVFSSALGIGASAALLYAQLFAIYLCFFIGMFTLRALILNHCWTNTTFLSEDTLDTPRARRRAAVNAEIVEVSCQLEPTKYVWIHISNILLTVLTVGFFLPWAKVRLQRYMCESLEVSIPYGVNVDNLLANAEEAVNSVGDSAVEFLDIDMGF